jgi:hypothetical protein
MIVWSDIGTSETAYIRGPKYREHKLIIDLQNRGSRRE